MTDTQAPERHADTARNVILNRALMDLDRIINGHDPENDTSLNNLVWDRLDKMAVEIEARAAAQTAAAWLAGRDAAADYCTQKAVAGRVGMGIRALTPPDDVPAALDAVIAERVREAVEAERESIAGEITRRRMVLHQKIEVLDISREDAVYQICVDVARASKEGR